MLIHVLKTVFFNISVFLLRANVILYSLSLFLKLTLTVQYLLYDADPDPPHCLIPLEMLKETFILERFLKVRCRTINIILKKYTLCLTKYW